MNQTVAVTQKPFARPKTRADNNNTRFKAFCKERRTESEDEYGIKVCVHEVRLLVPAGEKDAVRAAQALLNDAIAERDPESLHEIRLWVKAGAADAISSAQALLAVAIARRDRDARNAHLWR